MARLTLHESLKRSSIFAALSNEALLRLVQVGLRRNVTKDTLLFEKGQDCNEVLFLLQGRVRLWRQNERGQIMILHRCDPGDILGQMSVLNNAPHSVNATTDEDCEIWRVQASYFREQLTASPEALLKLAIILSDRIRDLSEELEELKYSSVQERIAKKLRQLGNNRREVKLTHESLAQEIGATRENVSRALATFSEAGAIALHRGAIEIIDLSLLP
jgi:CRP-like cAMP-binding protein